MIQKIRMKQEIKKNVLAMVFCFGTWILAVLFLISHMELGIEAIAAVLLITIQLISSIIDLYSRTIPLKLMISGLVVGLLTFIIFYKTSVLINCILGGVTAFVLMMLLILISRRQVGGGDLTLMTVTGFFAGINTFFSILFISIVLAAMYSIFLVIIKKGNKKTEIPFAPFILYATVICVLSGIR